MKECAQKQTKPLERAPHGIARSSAKSLRESPQVGSMLYLQRTIGNQAVQRLLQAKANGREAASRSTRSDRFGNDFSLTPTHTKTAVRVQPKLGISTPGDIYEQEADHVSEQVMRMPEPSLQRTCACGGACTTCQSAHPGQERESLQTKRVGSSDLGQTSVPSSVHEVLGSPGQSLDPALRASMESRFGHDFSSVRVHSGTVAEGSAQDVNAHAYTVGHNIVFGPGQPALGSPEGQKLLAHELTHVLQQSTASTHSVVQRQAGGGAPAGGAPPLSVKYNGCGRAPYIQAVVEAAALAAYNQVVTSNCISSPELRNDILSEFANLTVDCEQKGSGCGWAWRVFSNTVNIYPKALTPTCGPLESTILHEVVHLTELRLIEHGGLADACEASCFGWGRGDPAKCNETTLVRHGPRVAFGRGLGAGGSGVFGRFGYEVIRSWTGTAFSLGLHLNVPLTDRESFVRAGLEVGTNFQLLGSLYGRLFAGLEVPLPPGTAHPSTLVGAGLGLDFGRVQLEVLYDVLDVQSRDKRNQELMLGLGFRFGK